MKSKKIIKVAFFSICIFIGIMHNNFSAQAIASNPSLFIQMVPCGQTSTGVNLNGWSDTVQCLGGTLTSVSCNILFKDSPSENDKFTYFFLQYSKEMSLDQQFTVSINNARIETTSGKTILLDKLNGVYQNPVKGNIICDYGMDGISGAQLLKGIFKADVSVNFGNIMDYGSSLDNKFPQNGFVTYNGSVITLNNVNYNGSITLTGGEKYKEGITLVLKGNSKINGLITKCPVKITSEGDSSLTLQTLSDTDGNISVTKNISVKKLGEGQVYSASPISIENLVEITYSGIEKSLPPSLYYSVEGNTITLEDFHFDGSINITGGGYDNLKLILKGNNSIGALTVNCPIKIERYCYAKLTCNKYYENKAVSTDVNTATKSIDGQTQFSFTAQSGHEYTKIFDSEKTGFNPDAVQGSNVSYLEKYKDLEQYSETTVSDIPGITRGSSMTFKSGASIAIDLSNYIKACSTDEKSVLTFYARVVSDKPNDTAWANTSLIPQNRLNSTYGKDIFRWAGTGLLLTTKWQKFTFSGFWPNDNLAYTNLSLLLGCNTVGIKVEFCGVKLIGQGSYTASEIDELTGMYDFDWRHKDAAWRSDAQKMIDSNRKGNLELNIIDSNGKPLEGAKVTVRQTDYDYEFGVGDSAPSIMNPDGSINGNLQALKNMGGNSVVDYTSTLWENYYDDGNSNNTFEFDRSSSGDVDYVSAAVKLAQQNNIKYTAHVLVYPSFSIMQTNSLCPDNYDKLVSYVLSDEYSPDGFKQVIETHIKQEIKSYAGVIKSWNVVNEAFGSPVFFKLIYGTDGTGINSATIKSVTNGYNTNKEKILALEKWLESNVLIVPASVAGKFIAGFCDVAKQAWVDAGYNSDELILNYNDCATKVNDFGNQGKFYEYVTQIAKELAKPGNYRDGKVLIDRIGFEFADWSYETLSPSEIWSILDEYEAIGLPVWSTEFNYWLDNPLSDNKSKLSDYGASFASSGCNSKAELEFIYDYGKAVMTAMYAHKNSCGIVATSYPSGQIGYFFGWDLTRISPLGEAFEDLVGKQWHTPDQSGISSGGKFNVMNATLGKYEITVEYGEVTKTFNIDLSKNSKINELKWN